MKDMANEKHTINGKLAKAARMSAAEKLDPKYGDKAITFAEDFYLSVHTQRARECGRDNLSLASRNFYLIVEEEPELVKEILDRKLAPKP